MRRTSMDLKASLEQKFAESVTCYGHCTQPSSFTVVSDQPLVACYHCMAGYASRIMTYGREGEVDVTEFKKYIAKTIGSLGTVQDEDIRSATRHPWDAPDLAGEVRVAYWTQNYRRSKVDDQSRAALFLCGNCSSFFIQPITERSVLCSNCRPETP